MRRPRTQPGGLDRAKLWLRSTNTPQHTQERPPHPHPHVGFRPWRGGEQQESKDKDEEVQSAGTRWLSSAARPLGVKSCCGGDTAGRWGGVGWGGRLLICTRWDEKRLIDTVPNSQPAGRRWQHVNVSEPPSAAAAAVREEEEEPGRRSPRNHHTKPLTPDP